MFQIVIKCTQINMCMLPTYFIIFIYIYYIVLWFPGLSMNDDAISCIVFMFTNNIQTLIVVVVVVANNNEKKKKK